MQCPVCRHEQETGPAAAECGRCGTDLALLRYVRDLPLKLAEEGAALAGQGRLIEAVDRLQAAVALRPDDAAVRRSLFGALEAAGLDDLAWVHLHRLRRDTQESDPELEAASHRIHRRRRARAWADRLARWIGACLP